MMGELVMGRFRVRERIGSGGMGTVYRAFDERLQRDVAVKELSVADPERVLREAQAAARLNHPGIVTLYELGHEGDRALLVSELIAGSTLDQLARAGELSDRDVAELGSDVCEALAHAHQRGVVHRDVKPQNVIARGDERGGLRAKLMDFGIASVAGAPALTATGEVIGTLAYMAPEQAEGLEAGPEADVYSLALTLYECWAGESPVARRTPAQTAREIGRPPPSLREYRPDLPAGLTSRVDACLDADPQERPDLGELRAGLERAIPGLDHARAVPAPSGLLDEADSRDWTPALGRLAALALLGALVALIAGPAGRPGLALVLGALVAPALCFASSLARAPIPLLAVPLGALGAGAALPAAAAAGERATLGRAALGALGWCWMLIAAAVLGGPSGAGIVEAAPDGWQLATTTAFDSLLAPLLEPASLLGMTAFGLAAAALGWVLRARHLALALLGALIWAASLVGVLRVVGDGSLAEAPVLAAAGALVAVAIEFRGRTPSRPRPVRPPAQAHPAPSVYSAP
jgi:eukaryotic-like serine/threonine-protein kinase